MMASEPVAEAGSFRDPSGFVYTRDGALYRQVNAVYAEHYRHLLASGLYRTLADEGLLVSHEEADLALAAAPGACAVLKPRRLPFISYPYEWCFSQLQAAARLTLRIQDIAFAHGLTLKDASAYNVQFLDGRAVLMDTLSFETYRPGQYWAPYRQFCQHFLAPLALMSHTDTSLNRLLSLHVDGVPLALAARLLPGRARWRFSLLAHIVLHARAQSRSGRAAAAAGARGLSPVALQALVASLASAVERCRPPARPTVWGDYYTDTNYSATAFAGKRRIVGDFIDRVRPSAVWDLGANTGLFSRLAQERGAFTLALDADTAAVERCYRQCVADRVANMLPLVMDLANPSPAIGWANTERRSLLQRGPVDLAMALALVHHLAIANNVPLPMLADTLGGLCRHLIVEFVPKQDSQVARMLRTRADVFPAYTREGFEESFAPRFETLDRQPVEGAERTLYLMRNRRRLP